MKQVIRIEYTDGYGLFLRCYVNKDLDDIGDRHYSCKKLFPSILDRHKSFNRPNDDGLDLRLDDKIWYCGYKNVEQLQLWITSEELKSIIEYGFRILLLDVNEYQEGRDQIIYTKKNIINSKDISELFK